MTDRAAREAPPSDLELMLLADGELEGDRLAEVEAWLQRDQARQAKLAALGVVSRVVRDRALETSAGVDLTDAIMARVERAPAPTPMGETPKLRAMGEAPRPPARAANENGGRAVFVIAAAVVAAAAAAFLWMRPATPPERGPVARSHATATHAPLGFAPAPAHGNAAEADVEHGVEVAAVDFGSSTGAVLYVPNGPSPSDTTTVVWLSDDSGEDE